MKTKIIILLFVTIILTACTSTTKKDDISFTVLFNAVDEAPLNSEWLILEKYKEIKGVTLEVIAGDNEDYNEYIGLALNSKLPPEVVLNCWPDTIEIYANQGLLLPISDYVDLMPFYQNYISDNNLETEVDKLRVKDGKYYILGGFQRPIQVQQWIYRKDLFDKHNIPQPTTYDELFESLEILKQYYPESTPMSTSWGELICFL